MINDFKKIVEDEVDPIMLLMIKTFGVILPIPVVSIPFPTSQAQLFGNSS